MNSQGRYLFDSILPGAYTIRWSLPADSVFCEKDSRLAEENGVITYGPFAMQGGMTVTMPALGALTLASVTGTAFTDRDADGVFGDGDEALAGAVLTLTREDGAEETAVSGEDGSFALTGLRPGPRTLTLTLPEGVVITRTAGLDLPLERGIGSQESGTDIAMGQVWADQMLGVVTPAVISGAAWLDENDNGLMDEGEAPLTGALITLTDLNDEDGAYETETGEDGVFTFEGVVPGDYSLQFTPEEDISPARAGDSTFAEEDGLLVMSDVKVAAGENRSDLRLGVTSTAILGGMAWFDEGGVYVPVPGVAITVTNAAGETVFDDVTDMDGRWSVEGMEAGEYFLKAEFPEGYVPVEPGDVRLTEGGQVSLMETIHGRTGESGPITLRMGADLLDLNVGSVAPGSLGDLVWLDENGDGLQDSGDGGIPGVTVHLWRNGEEIASTVTDQYGFYRFEGLYPGIYTLTADVTGLMPTVQRADIPGIISVTGEAESLPVQVTSDSHNYNADLGYVLTTPGAYPEGYGQGATQQWQ